MLIFLQNVGLFSWVWGFSHPKSVGWSRRYESWTLSPILLERNPREVPYVSISGSRYCLSQSGDEMKVPEGFSVSILHVKGFTLEHQLCGKFM